MSPSTARTSPARRRSARRRLPALALTLAVGLLSACGGDDGGDPTGSAGTSSSSSSSAGGTTSSAPTTSSSAAPGAAESQTISATEGEMYIELSEDSLSPGTYTIEVTNEGSATHDLVVERDGADVAATETLAPGATTTLEVTLEEGDYVFYCSVGNHRAMGMETTVAVSA